MLSLSWQRWTLMAPYSPLRVLGAAPRRAPPLPSNKQPVTTSVLRPIEAPRGRGRPKKPVPTTNLEQETDEPEQPVVTPRSRGRPKKKVHQWFKQVLGAVKLQREVQLENSNDEEGAMPSKQPTTAPRPRGCPKKQVTANTSLPPGGSGEQKTTATEATIVAAEDELRAEIRKLSDGSPARRLAPPPRRGRGRPKRTETANTEVAASDEKSPDVAENTHEAPETEINTLGGGPDATSNNGNIPIKRGRGRPRKSDTPTKSAITGLQDTAGPSQLTRTLPDRSVAGYSPAGTAAAGVKKRGRGRPKKNSSDFVIAAEVATNGGVEEYDDEVVDSQVEFKDETKEDLRNFDVHDENDLDEDEDSEPSHSLSRSPSPPSSQPTIFRKRGAPLNETDLQTSKKWLIGFAAARRTVSRISFHKDTTTGTANKPAVEKSYTTTTTNPFLASLVGDYNVNYAIMGDKDHPGRLTIKFATDGDDMLTGSLELSRWSGVVRLALTEQRIRQYILKQERIEQQGLVLSDIMHPDEEEDGISLLEDRIPTNLKGNGVANAKSTHKRKASSGIDAEIPPKHHKVYPLSSSEVHALYFAYRIKNILTQEVQHKAQIGTVQFYTTKEGRMAFENAMVSVPGSEINELSGEARKEKGPEWPTQGWLWGDFAEPRST